MDTDEEVLQFVKDELRCRQLQANSSLSNGRHQTVPEDIYELMDKYSEKFNVDCSNIYWRRYFPKIVFPFLPNAILCERFKSDRHKPEPFTVQMLIDSAKAGRWLYD